MCVCVYVCVCVCVAEAHFGQQASPDPNLEVHAGVFAGDARLDGKAVQGWHVRLRGQPQIREGGPPCRFNMG